MSLQQPDREGGAWIGQRPDPNTDGIRETLDDGAERVAVTNTESDDSTHGGDRPIQRMDEKPRQEDRRDRPPRLADQETA